MNAQATDFDKNANTIQMKVEQTSVGDIFTFWVPITENHSINVSSNGSKITGNFWDPAAKKYREFYVEKDHPSSDISMEEVTLPGWKKYIISVLN